MRTNTDGPRATAGKFLTFLLQDETYGVPILLVREIIAVHPITPLPHLPDHVRGVINLRGRIIPVIDLRLRLGMPARPYDSHTCIVVIDARMDDREESTPMGCIVDTVSEVLSVDAAHLEPTPSFGPSVNTSIALGLARHPTRKCVVTLLDMQAILSDLDECVPLHEAA